MPVKTELARLREARNKVIERAAKAERSGRVDQKIKWERRKAVVDREIALLKALEHGTVLTKRAFVSYSTGGLIYFRRLEALLAAADFEIVTGFEESPKSGGTLLRIVLDQIRSSTFFLGILTKEIQVNHASGVRWAPSVWLSEEKGMALALDKPFLLMVHREIHDDFWKKTTPDKAHVFFDDDNFERKAQEAVQRASNRYYEYLERHTQPVAVFDDSAFGA